MKKGGLYPITATLYDFFKLPNYFALLTDPEPVIA